jgi:hypothetical protein
MNSSDAVQNTQQVALWQCVFDRKQMDRQSDGQIDGQTKRQTD